MPQTVVEQQREYLHEILCDIDGLSKVYFQPPNNIQLEYPCLIYSIERMSMHHSDNKRYLTFPVYSLILIDHNPESIIQKRILDLDSDCYVSFDRFYVSDNLNHWAYTLTFTKQLW